MLMPWADASRRVYRAVGEFVRRQLPAAGSTDEARVRDEVDQTREADTADAAEAAEAAVDQNPVEPGD
jgi:hypothetical protein